MTEKYLLDTNLLIAALDEAGTTEAEKSQQAKARLKALLADPASALAITPLIRYEVLRGVAWSEPERYRALADALEGFVELDVGRDVSDLAADLFRFERGEPSGHAKPTIDKRRFDSFHVATAKCHDLHVASNDADITALEALYERYAAGLAAKPEPGEGNG